MTSYYKLFDESYSDLSTLYLELESNNFNKIIKATRILQENALAEAIDFSKIGEKIKKIWESFKTWFKVHVIDKLKELWQKLSNSRLANAIKNIDSAAYNKFEKIKFKLQGDKYIFDDDDWEDIDDFYTDNLDESVLIESSNIINEASKKDLQLILMTAAMIKPAIFFNINNYIDTGKFISAFKALADLDKECAEIIDSSDNKIIAADINNKLGSKIDEQYKKIISSFKGTLSNIGDQEVNADYIKELINNDLKSRMLKDISLKSVLNTIKENDVSKNECLKMFRTISSTLSTTEETIDDLVSELDFSSSNISEKVKIIKDCMDSLKKYSTIAAILEDYCMYNYTISANIGEALNKLAEIL